MYDLLIFSIGALIGCIISTVFFEFSCKEKDEYYNSFKRILVKISSDFISERYGADVLKEYHRYLVEEALRRAKND